LWTDIARKDGTVKFKPVHPGIHYGACLSSLHSSTSHLRRTFPLRYHTVEGFPDSGRTQSRAGACGITESPSCNGRIARIPGGSRSTMQRDESSSRLHNQLQDSRAQPHAYIALRTSVNDGQAMVSGIGYTKTLPRGTSMEKREGLHLKSREPWHDDASNSTSHKHQHLFAPPLAHDVPNYLSRLPRETRLFG